VPIVPTQSSQASPVKVYFSVHSVHEVGSAASSSFPLHSLHSLIFVSKYWFFTPSVGHGSQILKSVETTPEQGSHLPSLKYLFASHS